MDYTPISVGRVLAAFAITVLVGLLPIAMVLVNHDATTMDALTARDGYGSWVLGMGGLALMSALIGLTRLAVASRRRVVGWPSRA